MCLDFNPRAPVGRDRRSRSKRWWATNFNPRAPVGRDTREIHRWREWKNFNPRAPVGRDSPKSDCARYSELFQSPRPCGARRPFRLHDLSGNLDFNPRAPVGRDQRRTVGEVSCVISIPAPLWGATISPRRRPKKSKFQSPRPCGARRIVIFYNFTEELFQSPRPCGARP